MKTKLQFRSVKARMTSWFLLVALMPLVIVIVVIYNQRVQSIKQEAFNKLTAIRDLKVNEVNAWLDERTGDIQTISQDFEIRDLEETIHKTERTQHDSRAISNARKLLSRYLKNYRDYQEIFIIDPISGIVEISTDTSHEGEDKSKDPYFTEPLQSRQVFIKDIYFSKTLNAPSMSFSVPIYCLSHRGQHITGILVARIYLEHSLYALLSNRTGMGNTGETLIVNKDVLALNELKWCEGAPLRMKIQAEPALKASRGGTGITETGDYRDEKVLAAYIYIPRTKWGFVSKQDLKEVYAPIRSLLWNILILLLISAAVVFGIAILLARNIARPVLEMTEVSRKIREGDLSARNRVQGADELGYLAETFNTMADSISSQIATIKKAEDRLRRERDTFEEQVQERTLALRKELDERKRAEEALRESEERFRIALKNTPITVLNQDCDLRFTWVYNPGLGFNLEKVLGKTDADLTPPEEAAKVMAMKRRVLETGVAAREEVAFSISGQTSFHDLTVEPLRDRDGQIAGITCAVIDITERKRAEEALQESEKRYSLAASIGKSATWEIWPEEGKIFGDANLKALLGYGPDGLSENLQDWVDTVPDQDRERVNTALAKVVSGVSDRYVIEHRVVRKDGSMGWVSVNGRVVSSEGEKPIQMIGSSVDITDRKQAEEQIKASLKEKEVLLREIHHRVKNNMQVIASLLNLQSDHVKEKQYKEMLKESQNRIKSMSLIHEKLYQSGDLASIDFNGYVKDLVNRLFGSHGVSPEKIALKIEVEEVSLGLDYAIPCGLIINELVSNSLKYAFPQDREGEIRIALRSVNEDEVELTVSDDGIGMPEDLDFENPESLGLDLVTILAEDQLEGKVKLNRDRGTKYHIQFKRKMYEAGV